MPYPYTWALMPRRAPRAAEVTDGLGPPWRATFDGHPVWNIPGPPWGGGLCWRGPGEPLHRYQTEHPGRMGDDQGPVTEPCQTQEEAQAAVDAWWLAQSSDRGFLW